MSFDLKSCYGFGTGHNFTDYEVEEGEVFDNFNSYARITDIYEGKILTIDLENAYLGQFEKFEAGNVILIHASASQSGKTEKLGKFICAKIEVADGINLTLDKDISATFDKYDLEDYRIQAVTFANFHCLKVYGTITPQHYSSTAYHGGILALKCSDSFYLTGNVQLDDCGISPYQKDYLRPLLDQEIAGELDGSARAGEENYCENNVFPLNSGDGMAMIFAKVIWSKAEARIGNPSTHGKVNCRGAADSKFKPSNVTNVGGSSILLVCQNENMSSVNLAKYRSESTSEAKRGKGLARCYIATEFFRRKPTNIEIDKDKLYYEDILADETLLSRKCFMTDFGRGFYKNIENPRYRLNNQLLLYRMTKDMYYIWQKETGGMGTIKSGAKVLILTRRQPHINEITELMHGCIKLKHRLPPGEKVFKAIVLPEFEDLTLTQDYTQDEVFGVFVSNKLKVTGKIKAISFIFAKEVEIGEGAWLGDSLFLVAEKITGWQESCAPKDCSVFTN